MKYRYLKSKAYLVFVTLGLGTLMWTGSQATMNWALTREARLIGMDWAHHLEREIEALNHGGTPDGGRTPAHVPETEDLRRVLSGVFGIGHIFQFDYINAHCHCHVSLTSGEQGASSKLTHEGHGPAHEGNGMASGHDAHDHASAGQDAALGQTEPHSNVVGSVPKGFWKHVVQGQKPHAHPKVNKSTAFQYPVNYELAAKIIAERRHDILIRKDAHPEIPTTMAEVYHPIMQGDEVGYLVRVLVDLEEQQQVYKQLLLIAALYSALMVAALVGYPTWRYIMIARRHRKADRRVRFLANHDVLTNLYNRNNFQETVSDLLWASYERNQSALMYVFDLNDFKVINDFYGHPTGDKVLCAFASLLRDRAPDNSYIARLGGDEFVVVVHGIEQAEFDHRDFLDLPEAVQVTINGGRQTVTSPIAGGVVRYPQDAETVDELIQLADLALYAAKPHRGGKVCAYEPRMKDAFFDRLKIREEFSEALQASQIVPYYQPIVNMRTGNVEGFEALARWNHPEKGVLSPFVFADVLEDGEISAMLGDLMFEKIADEMSFWKTSSVPFIKVALNVTDGDLKSRSFADDVLAGLKARGLRPANLTIEVTENCLFGADKKQSMRHLKRLRAAGCAIALDDFGTGYSSITQLKELPITAIKIDKSFIDDVLENQDDQSIISAMLELGQSMNFQLVMEGIETSGQLALLKWMGSELAQGYYFARPMPAAEVPAFIERQNASYDENAVRMNVG